MLVLDCSTGVVKAVEGVGLGVGLAGASGAAACCCCFLFFVFFFALRAHLLYSANFFPAATLPGFSAGFVSGTSVVKFGLKNI